MLRSARWRSGALAGGLALALAACAAPTPTRAPADPGGAAAFPPAGPEGAKLRLSGQHVVDFSHQLVGAAQRFAPKGLQALATPSLGAPAGPASRRLMAYGDPVSGAWTGGVAMTSLGCAAGDLATNGAGVRAFTPTYPKKCFVVTRQGRFVELDPAAPTVGYVNTNLDTTAASTFTRTYVSMSGEGSVAFAISDEGNLFAVYVGGGAHQVKHVALGKACVGAALFNDPLVSGYNTPYTRAYVVANDGTAYRITYTPGAGGSFASGTLTATAVGLATGITAPFTGTALVSAPPVALNGVLFVGDRGGYVNRLDTGSGVLTRYALASGWPIEAPLAIDIDDSFNPTDVFANSGGRAYWVRLASGQVLGSQSLLAENRGTFSGAMTAATYTTFLNTSTQNYTAANTGNSAPFTLYRHNVTNSVTIPGDTVLPYYRDDNRLTHSGFMTGQPPQIDAFVGPTGRPTNSTDAFTYGSPPTYLTGLNRQPIVPDGTATASANLQGPTAVEVLDDGTTYPDDDGSVFIADTQHCNVLFLPKNANSGQKWASSGVLAGALDPGRVYTFAGSMNPDNVMGANDIGNGQGAGIDVRPARLAAGIVARDGDINLPFGICIGNLGLYIGQLNKNTSGALQDGAVLFVPRVGVTAAWGMTGLEPGKMYVLTTNGNPLGLYADRRVAGRDTLYYCNYGDRAGSTNRYRIMRMVSNSAADSTVFAGNGTAGASANGTAPTSAQLSRPCDVTLDDMGNIIFTETNNNRLSMIWVGGMGNTRTWGITAPVAGMYYKIADINQAQSCTFAINDPQVPTGCIYVSSGNAGHRIERVDATGARQTVAGTGTSGDSGDGGPSTAALVNAAYGTRGDGKGTTYVADRFNNRIRVLTSRPDSGQAAGYARFDLGANAGRPVYAASATLRSLTAAGTLTVPEVGIASPYLKNTTTIWDASNATPLLAPEINLTSGLATPAAPTTGTYTVGSTHAYTLPSSMIPYGPNPNQAAVFLGVSTPVDANQYYYPTGVGLPTGSVRSPEFDARGANRPTLSMTTGNVPMKRSIMSPPTISIVGGQRVILVANANTMWRVVADNASPTTFSTTADLTMSATGRGSATGTRYTHDNQFQPNPTTPLVDYNGVVHMLDLLAVSPTSYTYTLNRMNGAAAGSNMYLNTTKVLATGVTSALNDNAGLYLAGGSFTIDEAYVGFGDGRLHRIGLNP